MKKQNFLRHFFFTVLVGVTFLGCANVINGTTTLVVENTTTTAQTFTVSDSVSGKIYGTHTIAATTTENYIVERGYVKSTPPRCEWAYTNGVWVIKAQTIIPTNAINKLPIEVKLKDLNGLIADETISANTSKNINLYRGEKYSWVLDGQVIDTFSELYYVKNGVPEKRYLFTISSDKIITINYVGILAAPTP